MAGINIPISFTTAGAEDVLRAISSIETKLKSLSVPSSSKLFGGGIDKAFPAATTITGGILDASGQTGEKRKQLFDILSASSTRTLSTGELSQVETLLKTLSGKLSATQKKFLEEVIQNQKSTINSFVRAAETGGFSVLEGKDGKRKLNFENLKKAILANIQSLREAYVLSEKDIAEIDALISKNDTAGIIGLLEKVRSSDRITERLKNDPKSGQDPQFNQDIANFKAKLTPQSRKAFQKALDEIIDAFLVEAIKAAKETKADPATKPKRSERKKVAKEVPVAEEETPVVTPPEPKRRPKRIDSSTSGVRYGRFDTSGMGGGGSGGGIVPPTGGGGYNFDGGEIEDYFDRVRRRFGRITASFQAANAVARDSLRTITPESVEEFLTVFRKNLVQFRQGTEQILVEEGPLRDLDPEVSRRLSERIVGVATSAEFGNLSQEQQAQRARVLGRESLDEFFPDLDSETAERALRVFSQQVLATTKEFKVVTETIDNINEELSRTARIEAEELIQRGRQSGDAQYYEQARQRIRQRRVLFVGKDLGVQIKTDEDLTDEERESLPSKVSSDIESNKRTVNRGILQAMGRPRGIFEQVATLGGRVAAIFSLVQFTIGNAVMQLQQFTEQANQLERVSATVGALAGNFESFSGALDLAATQQRKFGGTLEENLQGLTSLIPVSKRYNADLEQLDNIARRLAIVDPLQGFSGAAIALKEFFSGDITSLSRRFEIDRATLNSIKEAGDKTAQLQKLDEVLNKLGISNEVLNARTQTTAAVFDRLGGTTSNLSASFGFLIQEAIAPSAGALDRWLGQCSYLTAQIVEDKALLLEVSKGFAEINEIVREYLNLPIGDRTVKQLEEIQLAQNEVIRKYNEARDTQVKFIKDAETALQLARIAAEGGPNNILADLADVYSEDEVFGLVGMDDRQFRTMVLQAEALTSLRDELIGWLNTPWGLQGAIINENFSPEQSALLVEILDQLVTKRNDLSEADRETLFADVTQATEDLVNLNLTAKEYLDVLIKIRDTNYEIEQNKPRANPEYIRDGGGGGNSDDAGYGKSATLRSRIGSEIKAVNDAIREQRRLLAGLEDDGGEMSPELKALMDNLDALNVKVGDYTSSLELAKKTVEGINELTAKQTQAQLEQFAIAQGLGSEYSAQATAKMDEFKQTSEYLKSEEFDRFALLARVREALKLQQGLAFEQNKSVSAITLMKNNMLGYNITFKEAVELAKDFQNSLRSLATGTLLSKLSLEDQLTYQTNRLSLTGPNAPQNQGDLFDALNSSLNLYFQKTNEGQKNTGNRLVDIAKDDAARRQEITEQYNEDLLDMQEDYEKRKLELLKNSEIEKRQGKVDFYDTLFNADSLTPQQMQEASAKYEQLFTEVSDLRNKGEFEKATALLEAGTSQIVNEINYQQEVAENQNKIKEADADIAELRREYNEADSSEERRSILQKIEKITKDKEIAENRIKQINEIRTLQIDADNERVTQARKNEDTITSDYLKSVDERKQAYLDALAEQDAAYKKSVDEAKSQFDDIGRKSLVTLTFIQGILKYADEIPKLFEAATNGTAMGQDYLLKTIDYRKQVLLDQTPVELRPFLDKFFTSVERLEPGFGQQLGVLGKTLELDKTLLDTNLKLSLLNQTLTRTNEIFSTMPLFLQRGNT